MIEVLDLAENEPIGNVTLASLAILPRLRSVTARPEYLIPFIQNRSEGNFLRLENIRIRKPFDISMMDAINKEHIGRVYEVIKQGRPYTSVTVL